MPQQVPSILLLTCPSQKDDEHIVSVIFPKVCNWRAFEALCKHYEEAMVTEPIEGGGILWMLPLSPLTRDHARDIVVVTLVDRIYEKFGDQVWVLPRRTPMFAPSTT